jgi:hypothetical protein
MHFLYFLTDLSQILYTNSLSYFAGQIVFRQHRCSETHAVTTCVKECLSVLPTCFVDVVEIRYKRTAHSAVAHARVSRKSAQQRVVIFSWAWINIHLNFESTPEENLCTPSRSTQSAILCRRTDSGYCVVAAQCLNEIWCNFNPKRSNLSTIYCINCLYRRHHMSSAIVTDSIFIDVS